MHISTSKCLLIIVCSIAFIVLLFKGLLYLASSEKSNAPTDMTGNYSNYHKCEYPGCSNYASQTQYCSKHTTYKKCAKRGCSNSVSYSGAKYCAKHELEQYHNN